jgi:hypothetical protein
MTKRKFCFLAFCVLVPVLILSSAASATLLLNGSFETATDDGYGHMVPDNWGVYTDDWDNIDHQQVVDAGFAQDGSAYWMLEDTSTGSPIIGLQDLGVVADVSYTFSVYVRTNSGPSATAEIGFDYFSADQSVWWGQDVITVTVVGNQWTQYTHTATKWAGSYMKVKVAIENDLLYVDNAVLVPEPSTVALLGLGSLVLLRRRRH